MKITDNQNGSIEAQWPRVRKIDNNEFQQNFAVAQLAVKLCELRKAGSKVPLEKENLDPKKFLEQAWDLIQSARQHVLRPQTNAEYLADDHGSHMAAENVVERIRDPSRVPFKKLCDPERNKGDTETIKRMMPRPEKPSKWNGKYIAVKVVNALLPISFWITGMPTVSLEIRTIGRNTVRRSLNCGSGTAYLLTTFSLWLCFAENETKSAPRISRRSRNGTVGG